ncbi:hypothetical protein ABZX65_26945 [Streptomyces sp. NPDC003300]|uniref:hypothetical protein n=1 Tax=unclassified Streptomyces TaxID=2593676 RepID=UPI0033B8CD44
MSAVPVCGDRHAVLGQHITCTEPPLHRGPHSGPGADGIVGAAWCTLPCQGRLCRGPCHPDDPTAH